MPEPDEDFRVRAARVKREKMQARLFDAMMQVCAEKHRLPNVIDEVIQAAGVARGTFYKYFASLEELAEAVGTKLSDDLTEESLLLMPELPIGLLGTAGGVRLLLSRAAIDPVWGTFAVHSDFLTPNTAVGKLARRNLSEGHAAGQFVFALPDVAVDIVLGSVVEGIRRLLTGRVDPELYIYQMTIHILQGLGVPHATARTATEEIYAFFTQYAPERLGWWRSLGAA
ncbi:hypothetical protein AXW74_17325 [Sphingobium sp. AM]|nr:hypothetical protein AXW74_17325 [Sphingobium sp. AM]